MSLPHNIGECVFVEIFSFLKKKSYISLLSPFIASPWKNQQLSVNGKQKGKETVILLLASDISIHTITHMLGWVTHLYLDSMTHFKVSRRRFPVMALAHRVKSLP